MNRREAEQLLPWFVAGTLSDAEALAVQAFIDDGEIAPAGLDALRVFADTVAERGPEEPAYDPAVLERAMGQLDGVVQEQPEAPLVVGEVGPSRAKESPGLIQRLLDRLQWSATPPLARLALAGQFALLLGLAVLLGGRQSLDSDGTEVVSTTVAGTSIGQSADFTLTFAAAVTEAEIRALLLANDISIVAGPSALGIYQVAAPVDADLARVAEALSGSPLVVFLQPVPQP